MPNKEFLEEYSLFRKFKMQIPASLNGLPKPSINMVCQKCGSAQTFNMIFDYSDINGISNAPSADQKLVIIYKCASCRFFLRQFDVYISPTRDYIYKFGQYPEWDIKIDKGLEIILGAFSDNYKKGLICESQGYGIGAFSYYRRITEDIIDELLESITELIESVNKDKYAEALKETKNTRVTQDKIDLVKDLLPSILRPNDMNPLGVLHHELSAGLHAESDESCLENASHIKAILIFLVNQIIQSKETAKEFSTSMRKLLDKKNEK